MKITQAIQDFTPSYKLQDYTVEFIEAVEYADTVDDLQDQINELADAQIDIYNNDLIEWTRADNDHIWAINEAMSEFGTEGQDFFGLIRLGQYKFYSDIFYEMLEEYRELLEEAESEEEDE